PFRSARVRRRLFPALRAHRLASKTRRPPHRSRHCRLDKRARRSPGETLIRMKQITPTPPLREKPLSLLSVVIPARDEEGCIAATVEHLHLELKLNRVPHEIVVVDDGSRDR